MFLVKKDFFKNKLRLSGIEGSISNVDLGLFQLKSKTIFEN